MARIKRITVKLLLDIAMCLVLVLLYNSHVLTLDFHEIAGIAILGVFLIHILLNRSWVVSVGRKLFSRSTPARTKFSYWMTVLLVISFLLIVVSGLFISKVLFKGAFTNVPGGNGFWRDVHLFFSAVSLILVGIHLGLYWDVVRSFFRRYITLPPTTAKVTCRVLLAAILVWGVYSMPTAGFASWLAAPVTPNAQGHGHGDRGQQATSSDGEADGAMSGSASADGDGAASSRAGERHASDDTRVSSAAGEAGLTASASADGAARAHGANAGNGTRADAPAREADAMSGSASGEARQHVAAGDAGEGRRASSATGDHTPKDQQASSAAGDHTPKDQQGADSQEGQNRKASRTVSLANVLKVISQYMSIIGVFAAITYAVDSLLKSRKRRRREEGTRDKDVQA